MKHIEYTQNVIKIHNQLFYKKTMFTVLITPGLIRVKENVVALSL